MPVNTSVVIRKEDNSFEATAYRSAYESYKLGGKLHQPPHEIIASDGIYNNMDGFFRPCLPFEVDLIDEFLIHHNIDLANEYLYHLPMPERPYWKPHMLAPVERQHQGCTYRVQFRMIDTHFQRLCISKQDVDGKVTRCCVLLLGIHTPVRDAPTPGPTSRRMLDSPSTPMGRLPVQDSRSASVHSTQVNRNLQSARGSTREEQLGVASAGVRRGSHASRFSESAGVDFFV